MVKSSNKNETNNKISKTNQNINIDQIKYSKNNCNFKKRKTKKYYSKCRFFQFA